MKRSSFLAVTTALAISAVSWADDPTENPTSPFTLAKSTNSPFSNGLGQILGGWLQEGISGSELADQILWLQGMEADEIAQRTGWMDLNRLRDFQIDNRAFPVNSGASPAGGRQDPQRLQLAREDRVRNRHHEDIGRHHAREHDHNGTNGIDAGRQHSALRGDRHTVRDSHAPNSGAPKSHSPNFGSGSHGTPSSPARSPAPSGGSHAAPSGGGHLAPSGGGHFAPSGGGHLAPSGGDHPASSGGGRGRR